MDKGILLGKIDNAVIDEYISRFDYECLVCIHCEPPYIRHPFSTPGACRMKLFGVSSHRTGTNRRYV